VLDVRSGRMDGLTTSALDGTEASLQTNSIPAGGNSK
jgi:hypothetical protein